MNPSANGGIYSSGDNTPIIPQPSEPILTGGSDMSLSGSGRRKSGKGLIIGGLLVVAALAVALVAVIMVKNGGFGGGGAQNANEYGMFKKYANYLLNGNENSDLDIGEYDPDKEYAVTTAYIEDNAGFFDKASSLWSGFYEEIMADEKYSEVSKMRGDVIYQNQLMDFMSRYMNTTILEEPDLLKMYLEDGLDGALKKVEQNYAKLGETSYDLGKEYTDELVNFSNQTIKLYSTYDTYGCIVDGVIDETCVRNNDGAVLSLEDYLENMQDDIDYTIVDDAINDLVDFSYRIMGDLETR